MKQPIKATDNRNIKKFDIKEWQTKNLNEAYKSNISKKWKTVQHMEWDLIQYVKDASDAGGPDLLKDVMKALGKARDVALQKSMHKDKFKPNFKREGKINEGNSYYDLKQQYYEISDNMGHGGLLSTLQDIARKKDMDQFDKLGMGAFGKEVKIWTSIHKLFNKSQLGKIL